MNSYTESSLAEIGALKYLLKKASEYHIEPIYWVDCAGTPVIELGYNYRSLRTIKESSAIYRRFSMK